jgi:hypothetical protein
LVGMRSRAVVCSLPGVWQHGRAVCGVGVCRVRGGMRRATSRRVICGRDDPGDRQGRTARAAERPRNSPRGHRRRPFSRGTPRATASALSPR